MKIKLQIPTPDDNDKHHFTSFLLNCSLTKYEVRRRYRSTRVNHLGEVMLKVPKPTISSKVNIDPLHEQIAATVDKSLIPRKYIRGHPQIFPSSTEVWTIMISFRYAGGDSIVLIRRKNSAYYIDNQKVTRKRLVTILAQILYRSVFTRDTEIMDNYIEKCINLPYYVSYALENRTPYYFYDKGLKTEVRINTKLISETEAALEISEGIWASISVHNLNIFISTYLTNSSRSKTWYQISPTRLWSKLLGTEPRPSEYHLMIEWLKQNRTDEMVQKRAYELLNELCEEYEEFTLVNFDNKKSIHIRGQIGDWVISPRAENRSSNRHQGVNTYLFERYINQNSDESVPNDEDYERMDSNRKLWRGPICIDNLHKNSSIGDQMAARAMLLKNDSIAHKLIYTLKNVVKDNSEDKYRIKRLNRPLKKWEEQ